MVNDKSAPNIIFELFSYTTTIYIMDKQIYDATEQRGVDAVILIFIIRVNIYCHRSGT